LQKEVKMPQSMNCSHCIFADTSPPASGGPFGVWQTGCKTGRLERFIERGKAELPEPSLGEVNNFYRLDTFCNMIRDYEWVKNIDKEGVSHEELVKEVTDEVKSSFGIVIDVSNKTETELKETIDSLKGICYPKEKITAALSVTERNLHTQIYLNLVEELREVGINGMLIMHAHGVSQDAIDKDAFIQIFKDQRSYICKVSAGNTIDVDIMNFVDQIINDELESIVCFEDKHNGVVFAHRGIVNNLYLNYQNYDLMINDLLEQSIIQKNYRKYETEK
tara:strand:- start:14129 stop:14959 length:831 start_codon:yes stop_codon:yes gene_type:complete